MIDINENTVLADLFEKEMMQRQNPPTDLNEMVMKSMGGQPTQMPRENMPIDLTPKEPMTIDRSLAQAPPGDIQLPPEAPTLRDLKADEMGYIYSALNRGVTPTQIDKKLGSGTYDSYIRGQNAWSTIPYNDFEVSKLLSQRNAARKDDTMSPRIRNKILNDFAAAIQNRTKAVRSEVNISQGLDTTESGIKRHRTILGAGRLPEQIMEMSEKLRDTDYISKIGSKEKSKTLKEFKSLVSRVALAARNIYESGANFTGSEQFWGLMSLMGIEMDKNSPGYSDVTLGKQFENTDPLVLLDIFNKRPGYYAGLIGASARLMEIANHDLKAHVTKDPRFAKDKGLVDVYNTYLNGFAKKRGAFDFMDDKSGYLQSSGRSSADISKNP